MMMSLAIDFPFRDGGASACTSRISPSGIGRDISRYQELRRDRDLRVFRVGERRTWLSRGARDALERVLQRRRHGDAETERRLQHRERPSVDTDREMPELRVALEAHRAAERGPVAA